MEGDRDLFCIGKVIAVALCLYLYLCLYVYTVYIRKCGPGTTRFLERDVKDSLQSCKVYWISITRVVRSGGLERRKSRRDGLAVNAVVTARFISER
jgi:hypothetical protein